VRWRFKIFGDNLVKLATNTDSVNDIMGKVMALKIGIFQEFGHPSCVK